MAGRSSYVNLALMLIAVSLCVLQVAAQPVARSAASSTQVISQLLSWFPDDTEALMTSTRPLLLPKTMPRADGVASSDDLRNLVAQFAFVQLLPFASGFDNTPLVAAMEGSRNFRPPRGLGEAQFQGAVIAVFAHQVKDRGVQYPKDHPAPHLVKTLRLAEQSVAVYQQKAEEDLWTFFVVFPRPDIAVVATDEAYLTEILARVNGKVGLRALPDTLPEWRYVKTQAPFWALRHFRINGRATLTSGFSGLSPEIKPDNQAIGLAFSFDPDNSKTATITFLTPNETTLQTIRKNLFKEREQGVSAMHAQYQEPQPGVLEGRYSLEQIQSTQHFMFILESLLGHAIFI